MRHWFGDMVVKGDNSASVSNPKFHSEGSVAASALEFRNSSPYTDFYPKNCTNNVYHQQLSLASMYKFPSPSYYFVAERVYSETT